MHPCFAIFLLHIFSHSNDNATIFGILQTSTTTSKPKLSKTHEKGRSFTLNGKFLRLTWEAHSDWICMMPRWSGRAISRLSCSNDGQLFLCSLIDGWMVMLRLRLQPTHGENWANSTSRHPKISVTLSLWHLRFCGQPHSASCRAILLQLVIAKLKTQSCEPNVVNRENFRAKMLLNLKPWAETQKKWREN